MDKDNDFHVVPRGGLEHGIVTQGDAACQHLHAMGRWFTESEGDFRGMLFDMHEDAKLAARALNRTFGLMPED